jgi:RNA polymerase-associated protein CTR9
MGRNTLRNQLSRALDQQREYEQQHREKVEAAKRAREEENQRRKEEADRKAAEEQERQAKIDEARQIAQEEALIWAAEAAKKEQEQAKFDEEGKKQRKGRRQKKSRRGSPEDGADLDEVPSDEEGREERPKRKRRVARASGANLSEEKVIESDEDVEESAPVSGDDKPKNKKRKVLSQARILDSDDEDEVMMDGGVTEGTNGNAVQEESDDGLFGDEDMADD